jgi:hypothetical protein
MLDSGMHFSTIPRSKFEEGREKSAMKLKRAIIILILGCGIASPLAAQDAKMAALFVMSFAKNVDWPAADSTYVITVLGDDPIFEQLQPLATAGQFEGRTVVIHKIERIDSINKTHILYIAPEKSNQLGMVISKFGSQPILVVTQKPGLGKEGADINIVADDGKLSFEVNILSMKKAGLSAKPLLLKAGKLVS